MEYNTDIYPKQSKSRQEVPVPTRPDGMVGIRAALNNMGFSNASIGYDDKRGMVTLNGRDFMRPGYLDDQAGVSYANRKDIQKNLVDFYRDTDTPVVRVSDAYARAAGQYGLSADALSYGNGVVSVGGRPLDVLYIDDQGKAWAWEDQVYNAARDYARAAGVQSPAQLARDYQGRYLAAAQSLAESLQNQPAFSYDPDSDPVFQAYQRKYRREGDRASRNSMASYAALTGGYGNSAAMTAGAQAGQYYAQQLTDTIPELAQQAYQRYIERYQTDLNLLDRMTDLYSAAYSTAAAANDRQRENANASAASNVARDEAAAQRLQTEEDRELAREEARRQMAQAERDTYWNELFNNQTFAKNQYTNQGLQLDNQQMQTFQRYYEQLLQAELSGDRLDNQLTQEQIYRQRMRNALGLY